MSTRSIRWSTNVRRSLAKAIERGTLEAVAKLLKMPPERIRAFVDGDNSALTAREIAFIQGIDEAGMRHWIPEAVINFNQTLGTWFVPVSEGADFLGVIQPALEGYEVIYRARHATGEKNWYRVIVNRPLPEAIETMRQMLRLLAPIARVPPATVHEVLRGTKSEADYVRELLAQPWTQIFKQ